MERCETCEHWKFEGRDWEFDKLRLGECKAIKMRDKIQEEAVIDKGIDRWSDEGDKAMEEAMMAVKTIAVDGSGYYAAVRTAPDFGCVLYEPKADKEMVE